MAIGDTIQAGLMRFDSSAYERAGQANAQANAAFGNALSMAAKGYFEGQEKKARAKEIEEDLIRNGEDPAAAKAISKNPFLQKEHQRRKATEAQMEIEANRLAMQAQQLAQQGKIASEANMLRKGEFDLKKQAQELDIKDANELKQSETNLGRFLLIPKTEEVETPEFKGLLEKFEPDQIPGTPEFRAKELSEPMGARAPIMASYVTNQPGFKMFEERTQPAPGVARLPERFQPEAQAVSDALADGLINEREGLKLLGGIEARAIAEKELESEGPIFTPGQQSLDKSFAESLNEFNEADIRKGLTQLQEASNALENSDDLTGPVVGLLPKYFKDLLNPESSEVQEAVEEVVQRNLRLVLGAQFTEKEGERLISRAYNPRLDEKENKKRVDRLFQSIASAMNEKLSQRDYFQRNGTLVGYQYKPVTLESIENNAFGLQNQSAPASPEMIQAINEKEKQLQARRLLHETPEFKVAGDNQ
tara:strand:+ start:211 stop:1641 length:1431 start_codon:yes stop_codon:yes gene_type:complete